MYSKIKTLFDRFQDEESRQLFLLKFQLSLCRGDVHAHDYLRPDSGGGGDTSWR
jgi:hypothetical protein